MPQPRKQKILTTVVYQVQHDFTTRQAVLREHLHRLVQVRGARAHTKVRGYADGVRRGLQLLERTYNLAQKHSEAIVFLFLVHRESYHKKNNK